MDNNENSPVAPDEIKQEFAEESAPEAPAFESAEPEQTATIINEEKPKKSKAPLIVIIIALIIIAGGVVAFFLLKDQLFGTKQKNDSGENKTSTELSKLTMKDNSLSDFDLSLLKLNNKEENKIYSPLSIKYALKMLSDGANGETKKEIDNLLGQYKVKAYLNNKNRSLANVLFVQNDQKNNILNSYINGLQTNYAASVVYDDFTSAKNVNKWVSDKTLGIISDIINDDDIAGLDFALINALAIDMEWTSHIQCAGGGQNSKYNDNWYMVEYSHEKYSHFIDCIFDGNSFETAKFDDGKKDVKVARIGASINNYDIVKELGEKKIRETVKPKYEKYIKENGSNEEYLPADADKYLDGFIEVLNSNYGQAEGSTEFQMYTDDDVKVFAKDLKTYDGTTLQYVGIMPKTKKLTDYVKNTDASKLSETIGKVYDIKKENFKQGVVTKVVGTIPFFNYNYSLDLIDNLKELGVQKVFNSKEADLSKLTKVSGTAITEVKHKADIDFSNDGIKAAAVTIGGGVGNAMLFDYQFEVPVEEIDMSFDKPYMYIIRDKQAGEVWFTGTVYTPSKTINVKQIPLAE
ncbi:hypothetical protein IK110_01740 [Candidatus Saccharibacteria bacterium]|nr:hypothetical protein [Candidatus Saccharibacteria bacterium]